MKTILAAFAILAAGAVQAGQVIDMRACPLNTVTFIDPVAGGIFAVGRVGANHNYLCAGEVAARPLPGEECSGPFGDLVLEGMVREPDDTGPRTIFAIWSTAPAAPCCGWRVLDKASGQAMIDEPGFRWFGRDAMPTLGDVGFASISFDNLHREGIDIFSPKIAMRCRLPDSGD